MWLKRNEEEPEQVIEKRPYQIIVLGGIFAALFAALSVYIGYYAYANRQSLMSNNYNQRQKIYAAETVRGQILASDGVVLAGTVTDGNGREVRTYPFGSLFAHAVGYSTRGKSGVEAIANYYLIRSDLPLSERMRYDKALTKTPGNIVYTTLNMELQETAARSLGAYRGAIIVSDPRTGAILAMVSKPDFDPNTVAEKWDQLTADSSNTELMNRVTQGLYPPGSTFKIVTALEYIREHPSDYASYQYSCTGSFTSGQDTIRCFHGDVHGEVDFGTSFAKSCNSSFANMGISLNRTSFQKTLSDIGFGEDFDIGYSFNRSVAPISASSSDSDMLQLAIGQGETLMTPLHLNMITAAVANGGVMMKPYIVDRVVNASGSGITKTPPAEYGRIMSRAESDALREVMEGVVTKGTASGLKGLSYTSAGKTGSAEYSTATKDSHAWFTGYAPAEDPQVAVTIIVENAGTGGAYAVPMARQIFNTFFGL